MYLDSVLGTIKAKKDSPFKEKGSSKKKFPRKSPARLLEVRRFTSDLTANSSTFDESDKDGNTDSDTDE